MTSSLAFDPQPPVAQPPKTDAERRDWLRLARSENVGPITFLSLLRRYKTAKNALAAIPDLAERGGRRQLTVCPEDRVDAELRAAEAIGARLLCLGSPNYPPLLSVIDAPPPILWSIGDLSALRRPAVGIVGARNASALGKRFAENLARDLAAAGFTIVSGLARGIDAAAHKGSLNEPDPSAAAVLAGGVDHIYPPENAELYRDIQGRGTVMSEMPIGLQPQARHFPRRNRIVSGLSHGVVVLEGAERSGSLITARYAIDQGREAMAAPGHPLDARAGGCNALLREGATLIRHAEDVSEALAARLSAVSAPATSFDPLVTDTSIAEALVSDARLDDLPTAHFENDAYRVGGYGVQPGVGPEEVPTSTTSIRDAILAALGLAPVDVDALIRDIGAAPTTASLALLELELAGRIERRPGGVVCRIPDDP